MDHERFVISLLNLPRIGRKSAVKLLRSVKEIPRDPRELLNFVDSSPSAVPGIDLAMAERVWAQAEQTLESASDLRIHSMAMTRPEFPTWLKRIPDPPAMLYVKGNLDCVTTPLGFAVIGTREPTEYGWKVAHRFGQRGAEAGCVVVSGLALGCDTAGHRGCLDAGGKTVAVLAHGLDRIYPKDSRGLADEILEGGGCWVSEYPPGMRAQRSYFVERDRIQSGLSSGVIVVETDVDGGTMHTARFAGEQGRPLACLDHPPQHAHTPKIRGNRQLLVERRAEPLREAEDFTKFLDAVRRQAAQWTEAAPASVVPSDEMNGR